MGSTRDKKPPQNQNEDPGTDKEITFGFVLPDIYVSQLDVGTRIIVDVGEKSMECEVLEVHLSERRVIVKFIEPEDSVTFFSHHLKEQTKTLSMGMCRQDLIVPGDQN